MVGEWLVCRGRGPLQKEIAFGGKCRSGSTLQSQNGATARDPKNVKGEHLLDVQLSRVTISNDYLPPNSALIW